MLGLDGVVDVAHRAEDLLGALKDGRLAVRKDLVDVLLVVGREHQPLAAGRRSPGGRRRARGRRRGAGLRRGRRRPGDRAPRWPPRTRCVDHDDSRGRGTDSIRVPTRRVHDLLDVVGEAELDVRRVTRQRPGARDAGGRPRPGGHAPCASRWPGPTSTRRLLDALHALVALGDQLGAATRELADPRRGRAGPARPTCATAPWAWRWSRCAAWSPASRSSSASWPRRGRRRPGKDVALVLDRPGRRAGHAGARRGRRRAAAPGDQRRRPRLRVRRPSGSRPASRRRRRSPSRPAAAGSTVVIEVADDGARRRRGRPARGRRRAAGCCRPTPTVDRAGAAAGAVHARLLAPATRSPRPPAAASASTSSARWSRTSAAPSRCAPSPVVGTTFIITPAGDARRAALPDRPGRRRALRRAGRPASSRRSAWPTAERHEVAGVPVLVRHGRTMPLVDLGRVARRARRPRPAGRRRRAARRRRRAAGPGRRRARGRARAGRQGARRASSAGCRPSPARRSTATAAWCWSWTSASSPSASWPPAAGPVAGAAWAPPYRRTPAARHRAPVARAAGAGRRGLGRGARAAAGDPRGRRLRRLTAVDGLDGAARLSRRPGRPGALRRRDARHGRFHADPHASAAPAAGRTCPS